MTRVAAAVVVFAAAALLSGCAAVPPAGSADTSAAAPGSRQAHWVEIERLAFGYPPDVVYTALVQGMERNGRQIVEQDPQSQTVHVSYPFSWLKNNWGGTLRITCITSEFGTTVTLHGDARDAVSH